MATKPAPALDVKDLLEQLQKLQAPKAGACQITVINGTPPDWGVVIVAGGTKFFYRDGSDYTDGPRPLNVGAGQSATFVSNDPAKCVFQFFNAINVAIPGQPQQTFTSQDGVGPGECLYHESLTLGPKPTIAESSLKSRDLRDFIKVEIGRQR